MTTGRVSLCLIYVLAVPVVSHAALVTTTITATVNSQYTGDPVTSLRVGDSVSITFAYDTASTVMHEFNADGSVLDAFSLTDNPDYSFFSDATGVGFSANIQALFAELGKTYRTPGKYYYDLVSDSVNAFNTETLFVQFASNAEFHIILDDVIGHAGADGDLYFNNIVGRTNSEVGFRLTNLQTTTVPAAVPEPPTVVMLCMLLLCAAGSTFKMRGTNRASRTRQTFCANVCR